MSAVDRKSAGADRKSADADQKSADGGLELYGLDFLG